MLVLLRCRPMNPPPPAPGNRGKFSSRKKLDGEWYRILGPKQNFAWIPMIFSTCVRLNRYLRICLVWFLKNYIKFCIIFSFFQVLYVWWLQNFSFPASNCRRFGIALSIATSSHQLGCLALSCSSDNGSTATGFKPKSWEWGGAQRFFGFDVSNFDTSKDSKSAIFKHLGDLLKNV